MNGGLRERFGRVAVVYGGDSAEREVSLVSGARVHEALERQGLDVVAVDARADLVRKLGEARADRVFNVVHGRGGEDGTLQGLLEYLALPYTGSGVLASALTMDKHLTKQVWRAVGLPTPDASLVSSTDEAAREAARIGYPVFVKPVHEGSSVGLTPVFGSQVIAPAYERAAAFDPQVLVERYVSGVEYTVSILEAEALPVIRLQPAREFYDYEAKYADDAGTRYFIPCGLEPAAEAHVQALALRAFHVVGARGWARIDLIVDEHEQPWLLELNTTPGMTTHSLVPMAAAAVSVDFDALCLRILESSL